MPYDEEQRAVRKTQATAKEYVKVPKDEYSFLKEVYENVQRQSFLLRIGETEKNVAEGKTKKASIDDLIETI